MKDWINRLDRLDIPVSTEVIMSDLAGFMRHLMERIPFITAGGGVVFNEQEELLMIHRRGYWDLPKGKQEKGEPIEICAVREVEEECGVQGPVIDSAPFSTYHLYRDAGKTLVKHSIWYRMRIEGRPALVPQTEEDISEAQWMTLPLSKKVLDGAYPSIREVLQYVT